MMLTILNALFAIEAGHRLIEETTMPAEAGIPYSSAYFKELDETGQLVFRYRLWFAFEGHVYGAERLDPEGNVLARRVDSDRHPKRRKIEEFA